MYIYNLHLYRINFDNTNIMIKFEYSNEKIIINKNE